MDNDTRTATHANDPAETSNAEPSYNRRIVTEGVIDVTRTAPCPECLGTHLVGLLLTDAGASNVTNVLDELEVLNHRQVRVTIEWVHHSLKPAEGNQ